MHVFKDVSYKDNNIVLSYVYQVLDVNPRGMFWTVTNGRYQITGENVFNNSQDNVVTLGTAALGQHCCEKRCDEGKAHCDFSQLKVFCPNCGIIVY